MLFWLPPICERPSVLCIWDQQPQVRVGRILGFHGPRCKRDTHVWRGLVCIRRGVDACKGAMLQEQEVVYVSQLLQVMS